MYYADAMEATVTRAQARAEIKRHFGSEVEAAANGMAFEAYFAEFLAEVGDRDEYEGSDVLGWLGY
jgi:hypothetical protein